MPANEKRRYVMMLDFGQYITENSVANFDIIQSDVTNHAQVHKNLMFIILKGLHTTVSLSTTFYQGENFCNFLFAFVHTNSMRVLQKVLSLIGFLGFIPGILCSSNTSVISRNPVYSKLAMAPKFSISKKI